MDVCMNEGMNEWTIERVDAWNYARMKPWMYDISKEEPFINSLNLEGQQPRSLLVITLRSGPLDPLWELVLFYNVFSSVENTW